MLITLKEEAPEKEREALLLWLVSCGLHPQLSQLDEMPIIGIEKNLSEELNNELRSNPIVADLIETSLPYKMVSRAVKNTPTVIQIGDVKIGGDEITMIAGPCAIESEEQLVQTALGLKKNGVKILRASAFKPRSSPYSFQGMGVEGLKMHKRAKEKHGLLIETEVMDPRDVAITADYVDILRVGARNMQNFDLLKELGKCKKPVILKRGMSATIEEWLLSAEYIMAHGNHRVILCERGIRTFETATRSTLDLSSIDPSHAAGRSDIIPALSRGAIATGADGLLIEVHYKPKESRCDQRQALSLDEFHAIATDIEKVAKVMGKKV